MHILLYNTNKIRKYILHGYEVGSHTHPILRLITHIILVLKIPGFTLHVVGSFWSYPPTMSQVSFIISFGFNTYKRATIT
jgi:hypothetical protein